MPAILWQRAKIAAKLTCDVPIGPEIGQPIGNSRTTDSARSSHQPKNRIGVPPSSHDLRTLD